MSENTSTNTGTHLIYLASFNVWVSARRVKDGWAFPNGRSAALYILDGGSG